MIPTQTLRERMREAMRCKVGDIFRGGLSEQFACELADAAIEAIGDPVLIKTADTLEPTFTLRAQDESAQQLVFQWACMALARNNTERSPKIDEAFAHADAFRAWPTRKWPD